MKVTERELSSRAGVQFLLETKNRALPGNKKAN